MPKRQTLNRPKQARRSAKPARRLSASDGKAGRTRQPASRPAAPSREVGARRSTAGARARAASPRLLDLAARKKRARAVVRILAREYPEAHCSLDHADAFQLLVATILSAQCTDARVNLVTPELFRRYPAPRDFAEAPLVEIEEAIRSTGFYRNKAKALQGCCRAIVEHRGGRVPRTMDELRVLPGIGRKTANVVLGVAYDAADGVVVDTHVGRIARKLGLSAESDAEKIERDLNAVVPRAEWVAFGHRLIAHGRKICTARAPKCDICPLFLECETRA